MTRSILALAIALSLSTPALAADNDPTGPLDPATCHNLLESYGRLMASLAALSTCGLPQCVLAAQDIRALLKEIEDAWIAGGCYIYPSLTPVWARPVTVSRSR